jgi:LysR family transcriptional regulator, nod-box dependent transcriptional activator
MSSVRLNRFDLNLLVALDALLSEKNVTRAGERVFLSQPAMSAALGKLRDYFRDPLLVRVGREFELTPRGLALVEPVRAMLMHAQEVVGTYPVFDALTARRTFSMMTPDFVVPWLMPRVLQHLVQRAPTVHIQLESWCAAGPSRLQTGEIDLFVTLDSPRILGLASYPESLCSIQLRPLRWVCIVASDHPEIKDELTREQFLSQPHIYVRAQGDMHPIDETVRRHLHLDLDIRVTAENVLEIPFMIPGTTLLALVPESLALQLTKCLSIRILQVPDGILPPRRIDLYWHRRNEPDLGHAWLRTVVRDAAAVR